MFTDNVYGRPYPVGAIARLCEAIKAVCPAEGASVGRWNDRETWRLDALPEATEEQRAAALEVMNTFEPWEDFAVSGDVDDPPPPPDAQQPPAPPPAPPSGASSYPGGALIDQRLSEAAGALTSEYQNRVSQLDPKIGDANARIVALFGKADRTEEETAELNRLYADVNGWTALRSRLTDHYVAMQSAMLQPGFDLAAFAPSYGWPA